MHVISYKMIRKFKSTHPKAASSLDGWFRAIKRETFASLVELRKRFPSADLVGKYVVFNIGGNSYRLVAAIHFERGKVYIREIMTHAEYSKDRWK